MMPKSSVLTVMVILIPVLLHAQTTPKKPQAPAFYSIVSSHVQIGESGVFPGLDALVGLRFPAFQFGVGAGYDAYKFSSIPVYADLRKDFGQAKKLFGYINAGYHFPRQQTSLTIISIPVKEEWIGGLYMDAGFGFRLSAGKKHRLLFSTGYSYKALSHTLDYGAFCGTPSCFNDKYLYQYTLTKLVTRISWEFVSVKKEN